MIEQPTVIAGGAGATSTLDFINSLFRRIAARMQEDGWGELDQSVIYGLGQGWDKVIPNGMEIEGRENVIALRQLVDSAMSDLMDESVLKLRETVI